MVSDILYASNSTEWETPQWLFDRLNGVLHFTLDPCASHLNHKCDTYYTIDDDGLTQHWSGRVFMNPPYGRTIDLWIEKAYHAWTHGNAMVACLLPARTDRRVFHECCFNAPAILFIKGRLKFGNSKNSAPFPSCVVFFVDYLGREYDNLGKLHDIGALVYS